MKSSKEFCIPMIFKMIKVLLHVFKTNRQGREEKVQGKNYEEKLGPE